MATKMNKRVAGVSVFKLGPQAVVTGSIPAIANVAALPAAGKANGDAYWCVQEQDVYIWNATATPPAWERAYQNNNVLSAGVGAGTGAIPGAIHPAGATLVADATAGNNFLIDNAQVNDGDVVSCRISTIVPGAVQPKTLSFFQHPGESMGDMFPDALLIPYVTTIPGAAATRTTANGAAISSTHLTGVLTTLVSNQAFTGILFRQNAAGTMGDVWFKDLPAVGSKISITYVSRDNVGDPANRQTWTHTVAAGDTVATLARDFAISVTAAFGNGTTAATAAYPDMVTITNALAGADGQLQINGITVGQPAGAGALIGAPPNPVGREGDTVMRYSDPAKARISVCDKNGVWHLIYSRDELQRAIAMTSLFQSAASETATGGATIVTGLPVPVNTNKGEYWTWAGTPGYKIATGDLNGDLVGEVMQPGDWLQSNGKNWIHIASDLLSKSRANALYIFDEWEGRAALEAGSFQTYDGKLYKTNTNVAAGETAPDVNPHWDQVALNTGERIGEIQDETFQLETVSIAWGGLGQPPIGTLTNPFLHIFHAGQVWTETTRNNIPYPRVRDGWGASFMPVAPFYVDEVGNRFAGKVKAAPGQSGGWVFWDQSRDGLRAILMETGATPAGVMGDEDFDRGNHKWITLDTTTLLRGDEGASYINATQTNAPIPWSQTYDVLAVPPPANIKEGDYFICRRRISHFPDGGNIPGQIPGTAVPSGTKFVWVDGAWVAHFPVDDHLTPNQLLQRGAAGIESISDTNFATRLKPKLNIVTYGNAVPATPVDGDIWISPLTGNIPQVRTAGAWQTLHASAVTTRPPNPVSGVLWWDDTISAMFVWDGRVWVQCA